MSSHSSYKSEFSQNSGATFYSEGGEDDQSEVASQFRSQQSNAEQSYYVEETAGEPVVEYPPTPAFEKTDCNMIIWGKW